MNQAPEIGAWGEEIGPGEEVKDGRKPVRG